MIVRVAVLVKDVPNPSGTPPEIGPDHLLRRMEPGGGLDPADEPGLELAVRLVEAAGGEVVLFSMGPAQAMRACRRGLALGAHRAVLVTDERLRGADALVTARVLAATIRREQFDLVIAGVESADGATGTMPAALAELLGLPSATFARRLEVVAGRVTIERQTQAGHDVVECELPALATVTAAAATPRHPSVADTIQARKKPIEQLSLADLGLSVEDLQPRHRVTAVEIAPERQAGELVEDEAEAVTRVVRLLEELEVLA